MRALLCFVILGGVVSNIIANAQAPGTQAAASAVDFSGVYVTAVSINESAYTGPDVYPLTEQGARTHSAYDRVVADPQQADDCAVESVPAIFWSREPMQIIQEDGRLEMRLERDNTVRLIRMDGSPPPTGQPHSELGYALGRWVGSVLTIETTHIIAGVISNEGYPMSRDTRMTERYWRNPGQKNLQMEIVVDDPANYTQPVTLRREYIWSDEAQIRPWECISLGSRDAELSIDELARMLEEL